MKIIFKRNKSISNKIVALIVTINIIGTIFYSFLYLNVKNRIRTDNDSNKKYIYTMNLMNKESYKNTSKYLKNNNLLLGKISNKIDNKTLMNISNCILKYYPSIKKINHLTVSIQKQPDINSNNDIEKNYYIVSVGENNAEKLTQYATFYVSKNLDKVIYAEQDIKNNNYFQRTNISSNDLLNNFIYVSELNQYVKRISGSNRIETAVSIAEQVYSGKISNVIIATGNDFPDGLSGSTLAQKLNAPILLTGWDSTDSVATINYVKNHLDINGTIYILGSTGAVSNTFKDIFNSMGYINIVRFGGTDRYETCNIIVNNLNVQKGTPIILTTGNNYPDALSFSSVAAKKGYPIILVNENFLSQNLATFIQKIQPNIIYVAGSEAVVGNDVIDKAKILAGISNDNNVIRIFGSDRYETSMAIARYFYKDNSFATFAVGNNFPDALAGSVLAAKNNSPIILVQNDMTQPIVYISNQTSIKSTIVFGSSGVISDNFGNKIQTLLLGKIYLSADHQSFVNSMINGAEATYKEYGVLPSITLAQAALESGWGTTDLAQKVHNLFGIKADSRWTGKTINYITDEYENNQWITITDTFRAYDNFNESIEDHGNFLYVNARYRNNGLFSATDYNGQADALQRAGYATDPGYADKLKKIVSEYGFDAYDHIN